MNNIIANRISTLRDLMRENKLQAYLVNGSDPHMSEYVPERWKTRDFLSGFTGSYGFMAITENKAVLWTDSRYYLQADEQLQGSGIEMLKSRESDSLSVDQWLAQELEKGSRVGLDGSCYSAAEVNNYKNTLSPYQIKITSNIDLIDKIWTDRPNLPNAKAFLHDEEYAGLSRDYKFSQIELEIEKNNADYLIISALDDLGWTFNIRGADVECNPIVLAFALIGKNSAQLFVDSDKFTDEAIKKLQVDGVQIHRYEDFYSQLEKISGKKILIDPARANFKIYTTLKENNTIVEKLSTPALLKSVKNAAELQGMKKAQIADGVALLDFMLWLETKLPEKQISEYDVAMKLDEVRSRQEGYFGTSFFPIVGYKNHGAIVHFSVTPETANVLEPEGILLFDSGGQYSYGTTDITRTIALGLPSQQMKTDYTLVLKGMIAISKIKFPKGTVGCHLDVLARAALWNNNLNYGHGTGHGVGAFMNVHEGPQSIRPDFNTQPLLPGNILSNEPGIYRSNEYGIRIENLIHCVEDIQNEFGTFLKFETLTLFPLENRLIDSKLLTADELEWVNNYHQKVLNTLTPFVNAEALELLERMTQKIES